MAKKTPAPQSLDITIEEPVEVQPELVQEVSVELSPEVVAEPSQEVIIEPVVEPIQEIITPDMILEPEESVVDFTNIQVVTETTIETSYLTANLSPAISIKSEGTSDSFKYPGVASGVTRIVVFPNEVVHIPVSIEEPSDYELEIFKRISSLFELVSDKLVSGCVVIKSISDTPKAIASESIIATLKVSK